MATFDPAETSASWSDLARPALTQWPRVALAAVCMGISAAATGGYALLVGPVAGSLFGGPQDHVLRDGGAMLEGSYGYLRNLDAAGLGFLIVAVAAIKGAAFFGQRALVVGAGQRVLVELRAGLYRGLLGLDPLSAPARDRGDLVSRFTVDIEAVEQGVSEGLLGLLRNTLQIAVLVALVLWLDPLLGLIGLLAFPPVAVVIVRIGRELRRRRGQVHDAFGEVGSLVDETAAGLAVIRAFGAGPLMERRFSGRSRALLAGATRAALIKAFSSPLNEVMAAAALALSLWYAHGRIAAGTLHAESFLSFFTALLLLYQPVKGLGQAHHAIQYALAALDRIAPMMAPPAPAEATDRSRHAVGAGGACPRTRTSPREGARGHALRLDGVTAGYGDGPDVLRGIELDIRPGRRLAVVGPSGAGKSTLVNLLAGFLGPRAGAITLDGEPMPAGPERARGLFALVPQEPFLFDDTIEVNVRCGRADAGDEEVREACAAAGVLELARDLPAGLGTRIGRNGADLSVGQRQRVCLARALLSRAPVLLLDETTAAMDGRTELALVQGLAGALKGRTVVAVTHRASTAGWADDIALLEDGRITLTGPAGELLERDGRLRRLFGNQLERTRRDEGASQ